MIFRENKVASNYWSDEGALQYQPRATPWVSSQIEFQGLKARPIFARDPGQKANELKSTYMLSDLEYSYSPVRDKVRDLREYL
jgi:hypothetical protein